MPDKLISKIRVEGLFGLYNYEVPQAGALDNAAILYGDNGVGKSTILRLVFHLLSSASNRGHRTALYQADFHRLEVGLSSGVTLKATEIEPQGPRLLLLEVWKDRKRLAVWEYRPSSKSRFDDDSLFIDVDAEGNQVLRHVSPRTSKKDYGSTPQGEEAYLSALAGEVPTLFILNADRRLDSDSVSDPSDEMELRRTMRMDAPKKINELVARSREIALSQALATAARWISRKAVIGANQGSMNVHSVYEDVLRRLLSNAPRSAATPIGSKSSLLGRLSDIDHRSAEYARYELATHLPTKDFNRALSSNEKKKTDLAVDMLQPYIQSVESRLAAVEPIYQLIDRLISVVNGMLRDKTLTFKLSQGFSIENRLGLPLTPSQLSSGEQQLLLLFCYVLTARDASTVFMIDEPELSLNVKWQRQLVKSLLEITHGASIQFIFASHSIELLAQHRTRVVKLEDRP